MSRVLYEHGLVIGKFYPPHLGHEYLIRSAAAHCRWVTVAVLGSVVESIPMRRRAAWLRETFADAPHVRIVAEPDEAPINYGCPLIWAAHVNAMREAIACADRAFGTAPPVDAVFTSESYGEELARHFAAAHVCLDASRHLYPVSGTAVRASLPAAWTWLPSAVRAGLALRIAVVGAESTGKTTLSRDLAAALRARGGIWERTDWVAEYGREYSANLLALARARQPGARLEDVVWESGDFAHIAAEQCQRETAAARCGSPVLVCDTDAMATCLWHERYMGRASDRVAEIAAAMPPRAFYLLASDEEVPFSDDGLRDGEHVRQWMSARFREQLATQSVPWITLRGARQARLEQAIAVVDRAIADAWRFAPPLEQRTA